MSLMEITRVSPHELRRRLLNPPGGRDSSELEIISAYAFDRGRRILADVESTEARRVENLLRLKMERDAKEAKRIAIIEARRAQTVAAEANPVPVNPPSLEEILTEVCRRYHVTKIDLRSHRRTANVVLPRQITMYLARHLTLLSLPQIGKRMGGRDHTTAIHAIRKIENLVESYPHLAAEIAEIRQALGVG
jgi:chromosomal replication initiation ATPase DnaA